MTEHEKSLENLEYLKMKEMGMHLDETIDFINKNNLSFTEGLANAILDRVLHHAHVVQITGKSYRLKNYYQEEDSVHN